MMIRSFVAQDGEFRSDLDPEEIASILNETTEALLWVDLSDELPVQYEPLLKDVFGFHPLAIDDALTETHTPKTGFWAGSGRHGGHSHRDVLMDRRRDWM